MTRTIRKSVGIIGLGIIGRRIADHLRHQGLSVFVWNRTPRPVPNFVGSPAELAQTCNYLQIFVSDDDALMRMIQTISMSLTPRHIVIAHPTVSPDTMREAAALVERRGARLVEAPFTGSKRARGRGSDGHRALFGHSIGKICRCPQAKRQQFSHARFESAANYFGGFRSAFFSQTHAQ